MKPLHFEEWLLNDTPLNETQRRQLDAHLRTCADCAALAESAAALRSAPVISPAAGFSRRFQIRLARQKSAARRKNFWGLILFVVAGLALILWLAAPYISLFAAAPAQWMSLALGNALFLFTTLQTLAEVFSVFLQILPGILSPYAWMMLASTLAGFSLLWTAALWRMSRAPQGVSA
ncbi:MAG: hypothetical protein Fur002_18120 [Anaerolineales bacterium]